MLLFKVNNPPFQENEKSEDFKRYARCIAHFVNSDRHQSEALQYSIEKTCRIVERMFPILLENTDAVSQE
jgi:hypothetical protein